MGENIKDLIKAYRDVRDDLDSKRKEYMDFEKSSKEALYEIEVRMLDISNDTGIDSFKSDVGTVFRVTKTYARLDAGEESKELRFKYAVENNDPGVFTSHVPKTHMKELLDDGVNLLDIGVLWIEEAGMSFRKPTK